MKTGNKFLAITVATLFLATGFNLSAQRNMHGKQAGPKQGVKACHKPGGQKFLNLTEEQKTKIKELRLEHMKKVQPLKNQLNEKKAHQKTLASADSPDMGAINKNIDEISSIQNKLMKEKAAHRQAVRKLLTEEQRLKFDMHAGKRAKFHHKRHHGTCPKKAG